MQSSYRCKWKVALSPMDPPLSDVGPIPLVLTDVKAHHYLLPIGPRLLLPGVYFLDDARNSKEPIVRSLPLSQGEAEIILETIYLSAIPHVIATHSDPMVSKVMNRPALPNSQVMFNRIPHPKQIRSSGMINTDGHFRLSCARSGLCKHRPFICEPREFFSDRRDRMRVKVEI